MITPEEKKGCAYHNVSFSDDYRAIRMMCEWR